MAFGRRVAKTIKSKGTNNFTTVEEAICDWCAIKVILVVVGVKVTCLYYSQSINSINCEKSWL